MAMVNVHNEYLIRRYHTHVWSFSTLFWILVGIITYLSPLLIAFYSLGFWLKESSYREQPEVNFKHDLVVVLHGASSVAAYSTFSNFNSLLGSKLRIPTIKSIEVDENRDGKNDYLDFEIAIPINTNEDVYSVQLMLFFNLKLHTHSSLEMQSMAYVSYNSGFPGSAFYTDGDLMLKQKVLLPHKGSVTSFNNEIIPESVTSVDDLNIQSILRKYQARNLTTDFIGRYPVWLSGKAGGSTFRMKTRIYYLEQTITYRPGLWQLLKMAWIQYLSMLFLFLYIFGRVKAFIFENQLVNTIPKKVHTD